MRNHRWVRTVLCFGILGAVLASGGEATIPEVTAMPGAQKLLVSLVAEKDGPAILVRSLGGEEQRETRLLPAEGRERFKLALIAQTGEDGAITAFSLVTWKPAEKKDDAPANAWPALKDVAGASARIRGAQTLMLRRYQAPAADDGAAKWGIEVISFRRIEPKDDEGAVARAKKESIEDGGARLIEDRRFTLLAPGAPGDDLRYGVVLQPVWKEVGKSLEGFDAQLVTTPAPAKSASE